MASKTAANKWKSSMFVISAYRIHKEGILDGVAALAGGPDGSIGGSGPEATLFFHPAFQPPEETRAATEVFLDCVVDTLEHRSNVMIAADEAKLGEVDTESLQRGERTRLARELRNQYIRQRNVFVNLYDENEARRAGFEPVAETDPVLLMFQVQRVVHGLKSGRVEPGEGFAGLKVDAAPYGQALEPKLFELAASLRQVNLEVRTTEGQLRLKNLALKAHDEVYGPGARCLEAVFRLAGLPELAERVKLPERSAPSRGDAPGTGGDAGAGGNAGSETPDFGVLGIEEPPLPGESHSGASRSGESEPDSEEEAGGEPDEDSDEEAPGSSG